MKVYLTPDFRKALLARHKEGDRICVVLYTWVDGKLVADERFVTGVDAVASLIEANYLRPDVGAIWTNLQQLKPDADNRRAPSFQNYMNIGVDVDRRDKTRPVLDGNGQPVLDKKGKPKNEGINATDEERVVLRATADEIHALLGKYFGPAVFSDSGNGYHLEWRTEYIGIEEGKALYADLLAMLKAKYEKPDLNMEIDGSVFNESRVFTVQGTWNRKHADLPDRPQRQSEMLLLPEQEPVSGVSIILATAENLPSKEDGLGADDPTPHTKRRDWQKANPAWLKAGGVPHFLKWFKDYVSYEGEGAFDKDDGEYHPITPCYAHDAEPDGHVHDKKRDSCIILFNDGGVGLSCWNKDFSLKTMVRLLNQKIIADGGEKYPFLLYEEKEIPEELYEDVDFGDVKTATAGIKKPYACTDLGNMERLVWRFGRRLKHTNGLGWLTWDGMRWTPDEIGKSETMAWATVRLIREEANLIELPPKPEDESDEAANKAYDEAMGKREAIYAWGEASEMGGHIALMLGHTESAPGVSVRSEDFDARTDLVNTRSGTIELATGELRAHDRDDLLTKIAPVDYSADAQCPAWEKFLLEVMDGDAEMVDFLQRAVGYSLTGETLEQCMFVLWGTGANGKTTFVETIKHVFGNYAATADFGTFTTAKDSSGGRSANPAIAKLKGARFVSASESEQGQKFAEALVKQMTGADTISVRNLYAKPFDFKPQFKVWLASNYKPQITGTDDGIWRRIRLVPFTVSFIGREDKRLGETLKGEAAGILAWAVRGMQAWREHGLMPPEKVLKATDEYRGDEDVFQQFIEDCCDVGIKSAKRVEELKRLNPKHQTKARDLWKAHERWARDNDQPTLTERKFSAEMSKRGFTKDKRIDAKYWLGIRLLDVTVEATFTVGVDGL